MDFLLFFKELSTVHDKFLDLEKLKGFEGLTDSRLNLGALKFDWKSDRSLSDKIKETLLAEIIIPLQEELQRQASELITNYYNSINNTIPEEVQDPGDTEQSAVDDTTES